MKNKQSIIFNRLLLKKDLNIEEIVNKLSQHMYMDERGLGLTSIQVDESLLTCTILSKTPSAIQSYNEELGILESTVIQIFEEVVVMWDIKRKLLYTMASSTKFSKAKQLLRDCLFPDFCFGNIEFMQGKFIDKIRNSNYHTFITDLHIKKFHYQPEAYGKFCVHIENSNVGEELFVQYSKNISKISLLLEDEEDENLNFRISISPRNAISIECADTNFETIINFIKDNL